MPTHWPAVPRSVQFQVAAVEVHPPPMFPCSASSLLELMVAQTCSGRASRRHSCSPLEWFAGVAGLLGRRRHRPPVSDIVGRHHNPHRRRCRRRRYRRCRAGIEGAGNRSYAYHIINRCGVAAISIFSWVVTLGLLAHNPRCHRHRRRRHRRYRVHTSSVYLRSCSSIHRIADGVLSPSSQPGIDRPGSRKPAAY